MKSASTFLLFLLLILTPFVQGQENTKAKPEEAPVDGQRVLTCGHSFHVWVSPMLKELAEMAKIEGHKVAGVARLRGAPLKMHWNREFLEIGIGIQPGHPGICSGMLVTEKRTAGLNSICSRMGE